MFSAIAKGMTLLLKSKNYKKIIKLVSIILLGLFMVFIAVIGFLTSQMFGNLEKTKKQAIEELEYSNVCFDENVGKTDKKGIALFNENAKGGILENKADLVIKIAKKNKIPSSLFMSIIASESSWGKTPNATVYKNPLSLMGAGPLKSFSTIEEGLDVGAKNLFDLYISQGLDTPEKIGPKYAPVGATNDPTNLNSNWVTNVSKIQKSLSSTDKDEKEDKKDDKKDKKEEDSCGAVEMSGDTAKFAISIAYPRDQHASANVKNDPYGADVATKKYLSAKHKALSIATSPEGMRGLFASCDRFVATVIINTTDRNFPWGSTTEQQNYLSNSSKWKQYTKKSEAQPGDVWVTRTNGHVILYAGKYQGIDTIVHASYLEFVGRVDNASYLNENMIDLGGRSYYGYHYVGKKEK